MACQSRQAIANLMVMKRRRAPPNLGTSHPCFWVLFCIKAFRTNVCTLCCIRPPSSPPPPSLFLLQLPLCAFPFPHPPPALLNFYFSIFLPCFFLAVPQENPNGCARVEVLSESSTTARTGRITRTLVRAAEKLGTAPDGGETGGISTGRGGVMGGGGSQQSQQVGRGCVSCPAVVFLHIGSCNRACFFIPKEYRSSSSRPKRKHTRRRK